MCGLCEQRERLVSHSSEKPRVEMWRQIEFMSFLTGGVVTAPGGSKHGQVSVQQRA